MAGIGENELFNAAASVAPELNYPASPDMGGISPVVENAPQSKKPGFFKQMMANALQGIYDGNQSRMGFPDERRARLAMDQQQAPVDLAYKQALTQDALQRSTMVDTPMGPMPTSTWKVLGPAFMNSQAKVNAAQIGADVKREEGQANRDSRETIANQQHELGKMKLDYMLGIAKMKAAQANAAISSKERMEAAKSRGITTALTTAGMKSFDDALLADKRLEIMKDALDNPNGQNDVAMLFNHIGMTLSAQKGARITNAEIERAIKTRSLPQDLMAKWDAVQSGKFLSPEQRQQMYELGVLNRNVMWENAGRKARFYGVNAQPEQSPSLPPLKNGGSGNKPKTANDYLNKFNKGK